MASLKVLAGVTLDDLSRCFLSKQRAYNAVVCDRSTCSHTTLLQRFVLGASLKTLVSRTTG